MPLEQQARLATVKVGAFVLTAIVLLIAGSLWIAGSASWRTHRLPYRVLLTDSGGIHEGDRVRLAGVPVGRVQRIALQRDDRWPVVMDVTLREGLGLRTDATATIATEGLMGASYLQIDSGSPDAGKLEAGGTIHGRPALGMEQAMARLDEIAERVLALTERASALLDDVGDRLPQILDGVAGALDEQNVDNLTRVLAGLRQTLDSSGPRLVDLLDRMDSLTARLDEGLEPLPELTERAAALLADLQEALGPDGARLTAVLDSAERGLSSADEALGLLTGNRAEVEAALRDLRDVMANLKAFSDEIRRHPYRLVRIQAEPERKPGDGVKEGKR